MDRNILCSWIGWYRLFTTSNNPSEAAKKAIYNQMVNYGIRRDFAYDAVYNDIPIL